jgi:glycosyltransferase involved in cell wall biosynthesis
VEQQLVPPYFRKQEGYGYACLKGMEYISNQEIKPDIVVFLDGDYSDYPDELTQLIAPILENNIDFVVGPECGSIKRKNSMTPQQIFLDYLQQL